MNREIGINGFGRVGKLLVWNLISRETYSKIVINTGTPQTSMDQIANYLEKDSTYGWLSHYLHGADDSNFVMRVDENQQSIHINAVELIFFTQWTDPKDIPWSNYNIRIVVDATGMFLDPSDAVIPGGSLRGHLEAGAEKVVVSAPFSLDEDDIQPLDCITTIMGINESAYKPQKHKIISIASCTTTCLAHMVKPLFEKFDKKQRILSISMVTVHAMTAAQAALDRIPDGRHTNERFYRSALDNIILTSTGATKSLRLVLPDQMKGTSFITQSVRVPVSTGSLVIMTVNIQDKIEGSIEKEYINEVYKKAASLNTSYIRYSEKPHVSEDIKGLNVAVLIEGCETHRRTAEATIETDSSYVLKGNSQCNKGSIRIPITQATIYGWYDNEMGNFVYMLSKNLDYIFDNQY